MALSQHVSTDIIGILLSDALLTEPAVSANVNIGAIMIMRISLMACLVDVFEGITHFHAAGTPNMSIWVPLTGCIFVFKKMFITNVFGLDHVRIGQHHTTRHVVIVFKTFRTESATLHQFNHSSGFRLHWAVTCDSSLPGGYAWRGLWRWGYW